MSRRRLAVLGIVLAWAPVSTAQAMDPAESAVQPPARFVVSHLSAAPSSVRAGTVFRVRGRVTNRAGRGARTHQLRFRLLARHGRGRAWALRSAQRAKPGRSRRFSAAVRVPATVPAGRYRLEACVRAWPAGALRCRTRPIRVTTRRRGASSAATATAAATPTRTGDATRAAAAATCGKGPIGWDVYRRLDLLPTLPCGVQTRQFSSFDRRGFNDDGFDGTYSCLRDLAGRCVIAEKQGPGEIQSIWFTRFGPAGTGDVTPTGNIRIELDGRTVLDAPLQDVVNGRAGAPFEYPLVANAEQSSGGVYIKVPMPYRQSMRISTDSNPVFYHVTYREFADADGVRTFDRSDPARDVLDTLRAPGTRDPKPAQPGSQTTDRSFSLAPGQTATLADLRGPGMISQLRLRIPQIIGTTDPEVHDDGRAFTGYSQFRVAIAPGTRTLRLTRRLDAGIGNQRAEIRIDDQPVGDWPGMPATRPEWADQTVEVPIPASVDPAARAVTVRNTWIPVPGTPDFNEFHYWVDSGVAGTFSRTDEVDVGPQHPADEAAHQYVIEGQDFEGSRTFSYPQTAEQRDAEAARVAPSDELLRRARVRISFDGQRMVDAPLGEFFGSGLGEYPVRSLFSAMQTSDDGSYFAWWPMPFRSSARVELYNGSSRRIESGDASVRSADDARWARELAADGGAGYFRATANAGRTVADRDWTFLDAEGRGKFVGVHHTMRGADEGSGGPFNGPRGYLEGDERVHVDGSRTPQIHGTGTEDFYEAGWYFDRGTFTDPFNGDTGHEVGRAGCEHSCDSTYRLMVGDAVPFRSRLRFGIEHGPYNDVAATYGSTAFAYQQADVALLRTDVLDVGDAGSEAAHGYTSAAPGAVVPLTSFFEGDDDTVPVGEEGRATTAPISFTLRVDEGNGGVRLRRMSDQAQGYQSALVRVDGRDAGTWTEPLANGAKRWLHDDFELPAALTAGKRELRVQIVPTAGAPAWHAARYEALAHVRPYGDRQAPGPVTGLTATGEEGNAIDLSWKPAGDNVGVAYYEVYGSREAGDAIGPETLLGRTTTEGFRHSGIGLRETWYYRVRAVDGAGNLGPASEEASGTSGGRLRVEAESLLPADPSTDLADAQGDCCGIHWSQSHQLWFHADAAGDTFTVRVDVPQAGTYHLTTFDTRARDYGRYTLAVDGQVRGGEVDAYDPNLLVDIPSDYGDVPLSRGQHTLTWTVTGKNPGNDTPWAFIGIDYLELMLNG